MRILVFIVCLFSAVNTLAYTNLDSLWQIWEDPSQADTIKCKAIDDLIWDGLMYSNSDSAIVLGKIFYAYAIKQNLDKQKCTSLNALGTCYWVKAEYITAIDYFEQSLALAEYINNTGGTASALNNIGGIYSDQGYHPKALHYFKRSLALQEKLSNTNGIAVVTSNIGAIYKELGDLEQALKHGQKSLSLYELTNDQFGMAIELLKIGSIYASQKNYEKALPFYLRAIEIREQINNKHELVSALEMTGYLLSKMGRFDEAIKYIEKAIKLADEVGNKRGYAISTMVLGRVYKEYKKFNQAIFYCEKAYGLLHDLSILRQQKNACNCLYESYKALGQNGKALKYYELKIELQDSLHVTETATRLQQMEFAKQSLADSIAKAEEVRLVQEAHEEELRVEENTRNISLGVGAFLFLLAGGIYSRLRYVRKSKATLQVEKDRSDNLLLNILPEEIAQELKEKGKADAQDFDMVSILFTDFKDFTAQSAKLSATELVREINLCFEAFDHIIEKYNIEKIKTIGDAYMAAGGLPVPTDDSVKNTVLAALELQGFIREHKTANDALGKPAFEMRVGIHTGPVVAGIVGVKKFQYDIWGDTVNTAARMESSGEVGKVNISQATYELLKDDPQFAFECRGKIKAKGKGEMEMYFVSSPINNQPS